MHPHKIFVTRHLCGLQGGIGLFYFKKFISYIDCFENGVKTGNAGHVRVIVEDGECTLDIHIRGWQQAGSLNVLVKTLSGVTLGRIQLKKGAGSYTAHFPAGDVDGAGTPVERIEGLQFAVSQSCYCLALWKAGQMEKALEAVEQKPAKTLEEMPEGQASKEEPQAEAPPIKETPTEETPIKETPIKETPIKETPTEEIPIEKIPTGGTPAGQGVFSEFYRQPLYVDKWEQLRHIYKKVHPFADGDDFISIEPKDFVVMREEYQQLVNNSFLLHGFYNYRHIILGRKQGDTQYYIGVPGTYYEREKMVASMFGFEGFEPSGEEAADAKVRQGDYGYYMKKVEI